MSWVILTADLVEALHDAALNPGELPGRARDKSLEGALARVENRIDYGLIGDVFDLAAAYAAAVAAGHCFNDGNKRTAFDAMNFCLELNGVVLDWSVEGTGNQIIALAQGLIDEALFSDWLRANS